MPADRPATVNVIVAALRQHRPALKLATAQLEAETIVLRLQEAGWLGRVALVRRDEVEWLRDSLAGGGGGVKRLGSKKRLDGTGSLRISPSAAARQQRGDPNGIEDVGGGVGLKHATLRRIGGRRAGLLDRPLP